MSAATRTTGRRPLVSTASAIPIQPSQAQPSLAGASRLARILAKPSPAAVTNSVRGMSGIELVAARMKTGLAAIISSARIATGRLAPRLRASAKVRRRMPLAARTQKSRKPGTPMPSTSKPAALNQ